MVASCLIAFPWLLGKPVEHAGEPIKQLATIHTTNQNKFRIFMSFHIFMNSLDMHAPYGRLNPLPLYYTRTHTHTHSHTYTHHYYIQALCGRLAPYPLLYYAYTQRETHAHIRTRATHTETHTHIRTRARTQRERHTRTQVSELGERMGW